MFTKSLLIICLLKLITTVRHYYSIFLHKLIITIKNCFLLIDTNCTGSAKSYKSNQRPYGQRPKWPIVSRMLCYAKPKLTQNRCRRQQRMIGIYFKALKIDNK